MKDTMKASIIIICDQIRQEKLERLLQSLKPQLPKEEVEVLLVQESDSPSAAVLPPLPLSVRHILIPDRQGIPFNRNQGIQHAHGEIIVFIDDDCWVPSGWLSALLAPFGNPAIVAVTGGTKVPPSTLLGDCIAALGFPGGGSLGFEKVWRVSSEGFTNHLSVGNCALRRELFENVGSFDESMKQGAEDTEFSYRLEKAGMSIKYAPEAFAYHEARTTWSSFVRWQIRRGRANYQFKKKVGKVQSFVQLRLWSMRNSLRHNIFNFRLPLIFFLLASSFALQLVGYLLEQKKHG